jgi:hypothetical protein
MGQVYDGIQQPQRRDSIPGPSPTAVTPLLAIAVLTAHNKEYGKKRAR